VDHTSSHDGTQPNNWCGIKPAHQPKVSGRYAAGAIDSHDAYPLANSKHLIGFDLLDIGTQTSIVFAQGNLDALGARDTFFRRSAKHATGHSADYSGYCAATTAANTATGNATHNSAGTAAYRCLGPFDLDRTEGLDGSVANGLYRSRFIARIGITSQIGCAAAHDQCHDGERSN